MTVGKELGGDRGELPAHGWAAPADGRWRGRPLHEPVVLQRLEVLAHRRVGEVEAGRQLRHRRRLDALQAIDDPPLGIGHRRHRTRIAVISEART